MQISNALWILICAVAGYWLVSFVLRTLGEPRTATRMSVRQTDGQETPKNDERQSGLSTEARYRHVLGVSYDAGEHEIKTAYKILIEKYHRDKMANLGDEGRAIAAQKNRELVEAFDFFKNKYEW